MECRLARTPRSSPCTSLWWEEYIFCRLFMLTDQRIILTTVVYLQCSMHSSAVGKVLGENRSKAWPRLSMYISSPSYSSSITWKTTSSPSSSSSSLSSSTPSPTSPPVLNVHHLVAVAGGHQPGHHLILAIAWVAHLSVYYSKLCIALSRISPLYELMQRNVGWKIWNHYMGSLVNLGMRLRILWEPHISTQTSY